MNKIFKMLAGIIVIFIVLLGAGLLYINISYPNVELQEDFKVIGTPDQIARGEYLANHISLCLDCHSTRDWSKFSAPIIPGTEGKGGEVYPEEAGFPGTFYAPNITPAALSSWTDAEIYRAITSGQTKHNEALFPLMAYLSYSKLDMQDAKAIIAYMRTLKPIENDVPLSNPNFPFSIIMKTIPMPAIPTKRPEPSDSVAYGKYMTTIAACADCHTPMEKGEPIEHLTFAGGMKFILPNGSTIYSANITPDDEYGIGVMSKEDFVDMFKYYDGNDSLNLQVGNYNTIMPWAMYAGMTEKDLGAIYTYLRTVTPNKNKVE